MGKSSVVLKGDGKVSRKGKLINQGCRGDKKQLWKGQLGTETFPMGDDVVKCGEEE